MRFFLLAALGLACVVALAGALLNRGPTPSAKDALAFPALAARFGSADRIEIVHAGHVLWLERRGQQWGLARQGGYPVRAGSAEALTGALLSLRFLEPVAGTPEALGLADPFAPVDGSGTFVRVLGTSGAVLCTLIAGPPGTSVARRPGDDQAWRISTPIAAATEPAEWSQTALPPLDPSEVRTIQDESGRETGSLLKLLVAGLPFNDVRPEPQTHLTPVRTIQLGLAEGTAVLTLGLEDGQAWLLVSGTAPWAAKLAPYAFALPDANKLTGL